MNPYRVSLREALALADAARTGARAPQPAFPTWGRVCEVCRRALTAKRSDARTCSTRCRVRAHRETLKAA